MSEEKSLPIEHIWQKVLEKADGIIPKDAVKQWISRIVPSALKNNELILAVQDVFTKQYIEPRYLALLGDAVQKALGAGYTVRLITKIGRASCRERV